MRSVLQVVKFALVLAVGCCLSSAVWAQEKAAVTLDGSTTVGPIAKAFAEHYSRQNPHVNITVSESGSGNGAKSLINGTCDIANMSRFFKESEFKAAAEKGVMPVAHVIALDGLAVIVHPSNPTQGLSSKQIHDIYAGKVTNWREVGGPDAKIVVISRDTNSGTYETFKHIIMGDDKIARFAEYVGSNGQARARVQNTRGAIAFVGLGFVDRTVKALTVDGVAPSRVTVSTGKYPIARPLFMFTNGYPKLGSHVYDLVTLHLTPKGQEIVSGIGFVPVTSY